MTDAPHSPTDDDEELSPEEAARLIRRYHLGAVAEGSAHLELVLRSIFSSLLGSPRASVVAAGQSVSWLAKNALAVIDNNDKVRGPSLGDPENVARFRKAIARCADVNARRNRLLHGAWVEGLPDGRPGLSQLRSKWHQPLLVAEELWLEDIERLADDLAGAVDELLNSSLHVQGILA